MQPLQLIDVICHSAIVAATTAAAAPAEAGLPRHVQYMLATYVINELFLSLAYSDLFHFLLVREIGAFGGVKATAMATGDLVSAAGELSGPAGRYMHRFLS